MPRNGIIAGCSQSTTVARILLFKMLRHLREGYQTSQAYGLSYCPNQEATADVGSFIEDPKTTTHGVDNTHVEVHKNIRDNPILDLKGFKAKNSKKNTIVRRRKKENLSTTKALQIKGRFSSNQKFGQIPWIGNHRGGSALHGDHKGQGQHSQKEIE